MDSSCSRATTSRSKELAWEERQNNLISEELTVLRLKVAMLPFFSVTKTPYHCYCCGRSTPAPLMWPGFDISGLTWLVPIFTTRHFSAGGRLVSSHLGEHVFIALFLPEYRFTLFISTTDKRVFKTGGNKWLLWALSFCSEKPVVPVINQMERTFPLEIFRKKKRIPSEVLLFSRFHRKNPVPSAAFR